MLADEVQRITGEPLAFKARGGVGVKASWRDAMRLNLHSRLSQRVLVQLWHGGYRSEQDLYNAASEIAWEIWFTPKETIKVEITAHNHGFAVDAPVDRGTPTPYGTATVSHVCLNDGVVEGLELTDAGGVVRGFSVQYHPEAAAGPHDAAYLFARFADVMSGARSGGAA